jgi:hypothetical protein
MFSTCIEVKILFLERNECHVRQENTVYVEYLFSSHGFASRGLWGEQQ